MRSCGGADRCARYGAVLIRMSRRAMRRISIRSRLVRRIGRKTLLHYSLVFESLAILVWFGGRRMMSGAEASIYPSTIVARIQVYGSCLREQVRSLRI